MISMSSLLVIWAAAAGSSIDNCRHLASQCGSFHSGLFPHLPAIIFEQAL